MSFGPRITLVMIYDNQFYASMTSQKKFPKKTFWESILNMILKRTLKGDSTYRKYLSPPVANPTYRLPSICSQRNTNDPAETEIKTVDSYR